jgi:hypothetical protein
MFSIKVYKNIRKNVVNMVNTKNCEKNSPKIGCPGSKGKKVLLKNIKQLL